MNSLNVRHHLYLDRESQLLFAYREDRRVSSFRQIIVLLYADTSLLIVGNFFSVLLAHSYSLAAPAAKSVRRPVFVRSRVAIAR